MTAATVRYGSPAARIVCSSSWPSKIRRRLPGTASGARTAASKRSGSSPPSRAGERHIGRRGLPHRRRSRSSIRRILGSSAPARVARGRPARSHQAAGGRRRGGDAARRRCGNTPASAAEDPAPGRPAISPPPRRIAADRRWTTRSPRPRRASSSSLSARAAVIPPATVRQRCLPPPSLKPTSYTPEGRR